MLAYIGYGSPAAVSQRLYFDGDEMLAYIKTTILLGDTIASTER